MPTLKAGVAKRKINLDEIFPIERFTYELDPLNCRVLILKQETTFVFVSLELTSLQDYAINILKENIMELLVVAPKQIFISVTHTFSTPHTRSLKTLAHADKSLKEKNELFIQILVTAVRETTIEAMKSLTAITLVGAKVQKKLNVNRDLTGSTEYWLGRNENGFSSLDVPVIKLVTAKKKILALIYSIDVQSSIFEKIDKKAVSGDFSGMLTNQLEDYYDCPVLFMLGAAADQIPIIQESNHWQIEQQVKNLATDLKRKIDHSGIAISGTFKLEKMEFKVASKELPTREKLVPTKKYSYLSTGTKTVNVDVLTIGKLAIIMLKPELSSGLGDYLRSRSPYYLTLVATMINGGQKYMVDKVGYAHYSYEALNSMFMPGSGELVSQGIIKKLLQRGDF